MSSTTPLNSHLQDAVPGHDAKSGIGGLQHAAGVKHGQPHDIDRGYVPVRQLYGKVVGVWGDAHIRLLNGDVVPLHVGDVVKKGEVVLTAQDGIIQIEASHTLLASAGTDVDRIISQVDNGQIDIQPAAGPNSGGAAGSLEEGLRVGRDAESVTPAALDFNPLAAPTATPQGQAVSPLVTPPSANPDSETTSSNTPIVFDPRGNDASTTAITIVAVAGHPISPNTSVTLPQGTITMNPDGTLTFTPNHDVAGSITFTYTESNGSAGTSTSTVTVNVVATPDHAPVAANDTFSGHENAVITGNVAANDTPSIDGGNSWTLASGTAHGSVTLNADGTFSYTPAANYSGPDSFAYTVTDADGSASTAIVTLNVAPVPLAADDTIAAKQNTPATGNLAANDTPAAGEANVWAVAALPSHGQVAVNADGSFTYVPTANYSGPDSFTYTITAADGSKATATARLDIVADPLAPASIGLRHDAADDTGASTTDSLTGNKHPVIDGIGQPDSIVTVTVTPAGGSPVTYSASTDSTGHWAIDTATQAPASGALPAGGLPDGDVALGLSTTNNTGVTTTATGSLVVDSTPPAASIGLAHDSANDTGASSSDGVTANAHPVLVGTGEPSSTVSVTVTPTGGSPITYTVATDPSGDWSLDTATATPTSGSLPPAGLPDGTVTLQVVSTDSAGNPATATSSFQEVQPTVATTIDLKHDAADDTGTSTTDGITNKTRPVLTGTGLASSDVTITATDSSGNAVIYKTTTDATGNWSIDTNVAVPTTGTLPVAGFANGTVALTVASADVAGNTANATGSFKEVLPTIATTIDLKHDAADDTGTSSTDGITNKTRPILTGTGLASSDVTITATDASGNKVTYKTTTDATGNWSIDTNSAVPT
ncbi:MAG: Ig-like domain-containing protein, partial [Burkholderiaceae bacterium]